MTTRARKTGDSARLKAAGEERVRQLERTVEQRQTEAAILSEVATRIHAKEDLQAILDIAIDQILDGLRLRTAWIFLGDQMDRKLRLAAHRGVSPAYLSEVAAQGLGECLLPRGVRDRPPDAGAKHDPVPAHADHRGGPVPAGGPRLHSADVRWDEPRRAQRGGAPGRAVLGRRAALPGDRGPTDLPRRRAGPPPAGRARLQPGGPRPRRPQQGHRRVTRSGGRARARSAAPPSTSSRWTACRSSWAPRPGASRSRTSPAFPTPS